MKSRRPVKLTDRESRLLDLLPPDGSPVSTIDLMRSYWRRDEEPFNARVLITTRMNGIIRKLEFMRDKRRVTKSKRRGPRPIEFRLTTMK
jgi:hypothetical protein